MKSNEKLNHGYKLVNGLLVNANVYNHALQHWDNMESVRREHGIILPIVLVLHWFKKKKKKHSTHNKNNWFRKSLYIQNLLTFNRSTLIKDYTRTTLLSKIKPYTVRQRWLTFKGLTGIWDEAMKTLTVGIYYWG